jgi:hypothetical protein
MYFCIIIIVIIIIIIYLFIYLFKLQIGFLPSGSGTTIRQHTSHKITRHTQTGTQHTELHNEYSANTITTTIK